MNSIQPPDTTTALSGWNVKHLGPEAVGIGGRKHVYRLERWETKNGWHMSYVGDGDDCYDTN